MKRDFSFNLRMLDLSTYEINPFLYHFELFYKPIDNRKGHPKAL